MNDIFRPWFSPVRVLPSSADSGSTASFEKRTTLLRLGHEKYESWIVDSIPINFIIATTSSRGKDISRNEVCGQISLSGMAPSHDNSVLVHHDRG